MPKRETTASETEKPIRPGIPFTMTTTVSAAASDCSRRSVENADRSQGGACEPRNKVSGRVARQKSRHVSVVVGVPVVSQPGQQAESGGV